MNAPRPIAVDKYPLVPRREVEGEVCGAGIEMLTPTEGVDFNDYLARVYQSVKRNWFAVMPASVELGDKAWCRSNSEF